MRYLPLTNGERTSMLADIGAAGIDDLFEDVPVAARYDGQFALSDHMSEMAVSDVFQDFAGRNLSPATSPCFLGGGAYRHHVPASVDHLIQRGEFMTAYTPYQPEISQGTLQTLYEFQTQVALLTGMDVANASMYDGATACAEAVLMARRVTKRDRAILSGGLHPHYRDVALTTCRHLGTVFDRTDPAIPGTSNAESDLANLASAVDDQTACVVVQNPDVFGAVRDLTELAASCHAVGALLVTVVTEVVSLGGLVAPGDMGADIVVAEGQSLGNGLSFGGPYLGLLATRSSFIRQLPGRLCGQSRDADGRRGYTLTLSAREQHIRREKATSNICTNSGLTALAFSIHLALLGDVGLRQLALINHDRALTLAARLGEISGVEILNNSYFNEFTVRLTDAGEAVVDRLADRGILAGVPLSRLYPERDDVEALVLVAATETVSDTDIDRLVTELEGQL